MNAPAQIQAQPATLIADKRADMNALLQTALNEPGTLSAAYRLFHRYSAGNALLVALEAMLRGEPLGPVASFNAWKTLGYKVRKGSKAYAMTMPVTVHSRADDNETDDDGERTDGGKKTIFILRRNWFMLHQVEAGPDAQPLQEPIAPEWDLSRACDALNITREAFQEIDGNVQGYATKSALTGKRAIAINPLAYAPTKTAIHELAHHVLGHLDDLGQIIDGEQLDHSMQEVEAECTAYIVAAMLGLDDAALSSSRAYIQHYLRSGDSAEFHKRSASRIFKIATQILRAGQESDEAADEE